MLIKINQFQFLFCQIIENTAKIQNGGNYKWLKGLLGSQLYFWFFVLLGEGASGAELMLDWAMLYTMTGHIETTTSCCTAMMAGFTFIKVVITVLIMTFRKMREDITRSVIANIMNSIIAIILRRETNIRDTPDNPREGKNGGNETIKHGI